MWWLWEKQGSLVVIEVFVGKYFVPCAHGFLYGIFFTNIYNVFILADAVPSLVLKGLQENTWNLIELNGIP